jgi:hypothetical protein
VFGLLGVASFEAGVVVPVLLFGPALFWPVAAVVAALVLLFGVTTFEFAVFGVGPRCVAWPAVVMAALPCCLAIAEFAWSTLV